ncbi:hypothetical protein EC2741950_4572 [Escherichia coli 2741950]|nr:hypothetical protein EC2741950_4572 [Escherichia coli 2741950]
MNNHTAPPETGRQQGRYRMKTELTLNVLQTMTHRNMKISGLPEVMNAVN